MVSIAVTTIVLSSSITEVTALPARVAPTASKASSRVASGLFSSADRSPALRNRNPVTSVIAVCVTTATTSEIPRTVRQWARMVETAPSRISPTPSGRSGITPGLAAGGGAQGALQPGCPPHPG